MTAKEVSITGPNTTLTGTRNTDNGIYYIDLITGGLETGVAGEVFLVDRTFCWSWRRSPFAMVTLLGKCFRTRADVRPCHVVKKPAVILVVHDETTGLKEALWRY